ncbi:MAG: DUF4139 domain-containing protein [bacterium]
MSVKTNIVGGLGLLFMSVAPSSFAQQREVGLTIYNDNLALVKDVRTMRLQRGVTEIKFQDVAAQIDPTSVYFTSQTAPEKVAILEQNYEYDLVDASKILSKYVDQVITLSAKENVSYTGTLLSASGKDVILRESGGRIKIVNRESVQNMDFPTLPEGLITRPTLVWRLDVGQAGDHKIEVGYLTSGIQWHAEYVAVTNQRDTQLDLSGWVSIDNKSGATYKDTKLKLVAGSVHRAKRVPRPFLAKRPGVESLTVTQFQEKAFFEYHLYTLPRPATVANNQIKQISLFAPAEVAVAKKYVYDGSKSKKNVRVNLEFQNRKEFGLGMALPKGKIRVYKKDSDQALIFVGEDFVDHTSKDEAVKVYVGDAFDIVGERIQKDHRSIGKASWEETWQIKLRNHKDEAVEITVVEHLNLNWEIIRKSHEYTKKDARTIEFAVQVPKDGETLLEYVVRYNR